ncbi:MAG: IS4 family transposase [Planctomycetaceae bacterium]|nr:IS4 family transposase [Planctomycetaceae bacterium]
MQWFEERAKRLGVGRASLGSLSESVTIFDPTPLAGLAEELSDKLPDRTPENFACVDKRSPPWMDRCFACWLRSLSWLGCPKAMASRPAAIACMLNLKSSSTPSRIDVTGANPKGEADERRVLERTVEAGRCYLIDRGYAKYVLWNAIAAADSQYVCRLGDAIPYEVVRENALTDTDRSASIVSDQIVQFGTANSRTTPPDHSTRLVIVKVKPHDSRRSKNGVSGASSDGYLRIVTNNLDVPAEIIAALYELRWTIELYFRIIKQLLGCRHLLSTKANGVTIQIYMAIIACIMILAMTGKLPTKRTYEMICFYLLGLAELEELEAHIQQLPPK